MWLGLQAHTLMPGERARTLNLAKGLPLASETHPELKRRWWQQWNRIQVCRLLCGPGESFFSELGVKVAFFFPAAEWNQESLLHLNYTDSHSIQENRIHS